MCDEGAGYGDTLLLAAGHFVGIMLGPLFQAQALEILHGERVALVTVDALIEERKLYVLDRSLEADKVEGLEDESYHAVAVVGSLALAEVLDELAVQPVLARIVIVKDTQNIEKGGLAGAGCAHDGDELSLVYGEVYSLQNVEGLAVVVGLVDTLEIDQHKSICFQFALQIYKQLLINNNQL